VASTTTEFTKDPDAVLDWHFDWANWLQVGETITSSAFIVTAGINVDSSTNTVTNATVWLSGGRPGQPYRVTNRIVTNQGRTDDRSITIRVQDR
jgi:hypothetical protein